MVLRIDGLVLGGRLGEYVVYKKRREERGYNVPYFTSPYLTSPPSLRKKKRSSTFSLHPQSSQNSKQSEKEIK